MAISKGYIQPTVLIILDGFGYSSHKHFNAIAQATIPHLSSWLKTYPHTLLKASGEAVGLLPGQAGNSEVGHETIGAGRIIQQDIVRIHKSIDSGEFFSNPILKKNLDHVAQNHGSLHLMGLLSDGGVHSHEKHLFALLKAAQQHKIKKVFVHAFLDGRDVPPKSAALYLQRLDDYMNSLQCGVLGSISGRFYAMDRDGNWDRTKKVYTMLTHAESSSFTTWQAALQHYYNQGITDEFIPPTQLNQQNIIHNNDGVIFFNIRPDRARQLTACFIDPHFNHWNINPLTLTFFITLTDYNNYAHNNVHSLFEKRVITNTLKDVLARTDKTMFSIAETEKYAHVTYFFGGGKEKAFPHETRILIPSIPAKNYVHNPEMSAAQITGAVLYSLRHDPCDFYLINYANADMVGHSGNLDATIKAIECIDHELGRLYDQIITKQNGTLCITADHGNAEDKFDETSGQPRTAHTTNPVPFIMIKQGLEHSQMALNLHQLSDIAPFILKNMGLPIPSEMLYKNNKFLVITIILCIVIIIILFYQKISYS